MSIAFHKILVPIDFSETAETALHYARQLAAQFNSELHLLHVAEDPMMLVGWPALPSGLTSEAGQEASALREELNQMIPPDERARLHLSTHVIVGQPTGVAIARFARDGEFELIVMGTHGRGAVAHALMGSVAEKVVQLAPCPVLTIRNATHRAIAADRLGVQSRNPAEIASAC